VETSCGCGPKGTLEVDIRSDRPSAPGQPSADARFTIAITIASR
jgi:hypothetical protein